MKSTKLNLLPKVNNKSSDNILYTERVLKNTIASIREISSKKPEHPILLMHKDTIAEKYNELKSVFVDADIHYAIKANNHVAVMQTLQSLGSKFEIASLAELNTLLSLGVAGNDIICSNPIKTTELLKKCKEAGVCHLVADSEDELQKIMLYHPSACVYLRLDVDNPDSAWPLSNKFGLQMEQIDDFLLCCKVMHVNLCGIAFHAGSQNNSARSYVRALRQVKEIIIAAKEVYNFDLDAINLGGGLPVDYTEASSDLAIFYDAIHSTLKTFPNYERLSIKIQPGRRLVAEAGILIMKVIGKAKRKNSTMIYLNTGVFNGLLESIGGIKYTYCLASETPSNIFKKLCLAGPSCDSMDIIDKDVWMPEPEIGDYVYALGAGAYTAVYAANFNGYPIPIIQAI